MWLKITSYRRNYFFKKYHLKAQSNFLKKIHVMQLLSPRRPEMNPQLHIRAVIVLQNLSMKRAD